VHIEEERIMIRYQHTQWGTVILISVLVVAGIFIIVTSLHPRYQPAGSWIVFAVMAGSAYLFGSLTVTLDGEALRCHFGPGLIRRTIPLREIRDIRPIRIPWMYGWGIRLTPQGWMFNVSGLDAVKLTLAGGKHFLIGTNEPEVLARAVRTAIGGQGL
jgi:hypothetical protein